MKQHSWKGLRALKFYLKRSLALDLGLKRSLALELCFLMIFGSLAQLGRAQNAPAGIDIVVVDGEGATVAIRQHPAQDPSVRVEDGDHRPLANVAVVFTLPLSGATGEFSNGSKSLTVMTDQKGIATARGLRANDTAGKLQIYVTANFRGLRARGLINLTVEVPAGTKIQDLRTAKSNGKLKWILLGVAAAGGIGAGAYFYANRSSSSSAISINAGSVVFGNPR